MVIEDGVPTNFKLESVFMYPVSTCCTRIFKLGDIQTEIMHLYSTGGLTCYWRIRCNEICNV